jgi:hypothetical protein
MASPFVFSDKGPEEFPQFLGSGRPVQAIVVDRFDRWASDAQVATLAGRCELIVIDTLTDRRAGAARYMRLIHLSPLA